MEFLPDSPQISTMSRDLLPLMLGSISHNEMVGLVEMLDIRIEEMRREGLLSLEVEGELCGD